MNRFFTLLTTCLILAGCAGTGTKKDWNSEYTNVPTGTPIQMQYGSYYSAYDSSDAKHDIAVLLPLSGQNAAAGHEIRNAIELALLQHSLSQLTVNFYDTSRDATTATKTALTSNPEPVTRRSSLVTMLPIGLLPSLTRSSM